jgi:hypothetical protein
MKILIFLIITFLPWAAFDTNLFRRRRDSFDTESGISLDLGSDFFQQKKKVRQLVLNVIPLKHRSLRKAVSTKCNYFSTKSRDPRNSNQRKIRRKFNNM